MTKTKPPRIQAMYGTKQKAAKSLWFKEMRESKDPALDIVIHLMRRNGMIKHFEITGRGFAQSGWEVFTVKKKKLGKDRIK